MTAYIETTLRCVDGFGDEILRSMFRRIGNTTTANIVSSFDLTATAAGATVPTCGLTTLTALIGKNSGTTSVTLYCEVNSVTLQLTVPAGHMVMLEQPRLVSRMLVTFLAEVPFKPGM